MAPRGLVAAAGASAEFNRISLGGPLDARVATGGPIRGTPAQRVATGSHDNASSGYSQAGAAGRIPQLLMRHELMHELYKNAPGAAPH